MGNGQGKEEEIDFNGEVDLQFFNLLRCVGRGAFGKVRIIEKRDTKELYALKYINKSQCLKMGAVQNIFRERAILEEINNPFLVNLRYAFQDDENMFFVLDLMMGGDLRFHIDKSCGLKEKAVCFIAAEVASGIQYLHDHGIVHRDLKPDNILLDEHGHAHITDFNIAVHINPKKKFKSQSGTLSYMAPEVFAKTGYTWSVDWWSLGVVVFECIFGKRPFRGADNEMVQVAICNDELHVPRHNMITKKDLKLSEEAGSFIRGLLERTIEQRLGCKKARFEEIMAHPWFKEFDWAKLEKKELTPVFVPDPEKSNFDATYDLEEILLDDNPLKYKPRKKKTTASTPGTPAGEEASTPKKEKTEAKSSPPPKTRRFSFVRRKSTQKGSSNTDTAPPVPNIPKELKEDSNNKSTDLLKAPESHMAKSSGNDLLRIAIDPNKNHKLSANDLVRQDSGAKNSAADLLKGERKDSTHSLEKKADTSQTNLADKDKKPGDNDPYLTALQRNEHPLQKGKRISTRERYELEMEYIEKYFTIFDFSKKFGSPSEPNSGRPSASKVESVLSMTDMRRHSSKELVTQDWYTAAIVNTDTPSNMGTTTGEEHRQKERISQYQSVLSDNDGKMSTGKNSPKLDRSSICSPLKAVLEEVGKKDSQIGNSNTSLNGAPIRRESNHLIHLLKRSESKNKVSSNNDLSDKHTPSGLAHAKATPPGSPLVGSPTGSPSLRTKTLKQSASSRAIKNL